MNAYYQAERFMEIIEKAGGEELFTNKDGVLLNGIFFCNTEGPVRRECFLYQRSEVMVLKH